MGPSHPTVIGSYDRVKGRVSIRVIPTDPSWHRVEVWRCSYSPYSDALSKAPFHRRTWGLVAEGTLHPAYVLHDRAVPPGTLVEYQIYYGRNMRSREFGQPLQVAT